MPTWPKIRKLLYTIRYYTTLCWLTYKHGTRHCDGCSLKHPTVTLTPTSGDWWLCRACFDKDIACLLSTPATTPSPLPPTSPPTATGPCTPPPTSP